MIALIVSFLQGKDYPRSVRRYSVSQHAREGDRMRGVWTGLVLVISAVYGWPQKPPAAMKLQDPLIVDPQHYHLEIENEWTRTFRENMQPHGKLVCHKHTDPRAL